MSKFQGRGRRLSNRPDYEWDFELEWDNGRWLVIGAVEVYRSPTYYETGRVMERVRFEEVYKWGPRKNDWVRTSASYFMNMYGEEFSKYAKEEASEAAVRAAEERDERMLERRR